MSKKPTSFLLYTDLETPFNFLSLEDRGLLITYIFQYVRLGEVEFSGASDLVKLAFSMIKVYLDRDREHYEEKCRINAENGKKGGRPRKTEETNEFSEQEGEENQPLQTNGEETEGFSEKAKKAYNNNNYNYNYKYNNAYNYNNNLGSGGYRGGAYGAKEKKKENFGGSEWDFPDTSFDTEEFFAAALKRSYENI